MALADHVARVYRRAGFFPPVDMPPTVNTVKAGSAIPVKFSLGGDRGMAIFAAGYPRFQPVACSASLATDAIEQTVDSASSKLTYDATTGTVTLRAQFPNPDGVLLPPEAATPTRNVSCAM